MTRRAVHKAAAAPKTAAAAETPASATSGPLAALAATLDGIDTRMNDVMMAAYDAESLAGLLDGLHDEGYRAGSITKDDWQKRWWSQAGYIARTLERVATELEANAQAIETALADLKHGRAPQ
jgi:uncharacterized protein YukE